MIKDLELEELLKLAETETKQEAPAPKKKAISPFVTQTVSDVERFILVHKISKGHANIPAHIVYATYKKWKEGDAPAQMFFSIEFAKYFERKRRSGGFYYKLNPEPFEEVMKDHHLNRKRLKTLRERYQRRREKKNTPNS